MKSLNVNVLLKSVIGLLTFAVLVLLSLDAWTSWQRLQSSNRIALVADASSQLFTGLHHLRVDRAGSNNDLATEQALSGHSAQVRSMRDKEMPAIKAALDRIAQINYPGRAAAVTELGQALARLTALQAETSQAVTRPKAERRAGLAQDYQTAATEMLDLLAKLSTDLTAAVKLDDAYIDAMLSIKQAGWAVRLSAGNANLLINMGLSGAKLPPDALGRYRDSVASAQGQWAVLLDLSAGLTMPQSFRDAVQKTQATFLEKDYRANELKIMTALANGEKLAITVSDWDVKGVGYLANLIEVSEAALSAAREHTRVQADAAMSALMTQIGELLLALIVAAAALVAISRRVTSPLAVLKDRMTQLSNGDLTVDAPYTDRGDEIGALGKTMQTFKENMVEAERLRGQQAEQEKHMAEQRKRDMHALADQFDKAVGGVVDMVASAATELQSAAQTLTATAEQTSAQSSSVAAASEEASSNVASVASATEELSSSVGEISRQVAQSAAIASKAVTEANQTNERVKGLAAAADKIGSIVGLINEIAGKTNLLALNATIEAARAGDAGKGFAVVAAEVKQLADQTAKATAEISAQIGAIQDATGNAALAIEGIGRTIETMNEIASTISVAVDGQGAATGEIARNVQEASRGTAMVSQNITGVTAAASESSAASSQVLSSASELSHQAEVLRAEVGKFLSTVRAA